MASVLITGANRGIGLELTERFLKEGWRVLACCRQPEKARALQRLAERTAPRVPATGTAPSFVVDPGWPKPLPNNWKMGGVTGLAVDRNDNVWVLNRPNDTTDDEDDATPPNPTADCCVRPPAMKSSDRGQVPLKSGWRFCAMAASPSWKSSVLKHVLCPQLSNSSWAARVCSW